LWSNFGFANKKLVSYNFRISIFENIWQFQFDIECTSKSRVANATQNVMAFANGSLITSIAIVHDSLALFPLLLSLLQLILKEFEHTCPIKCGQNFTNWKHGIGVKHKALFLLQFVL